MFKVKQPIDAYATNKQKQNYQYFHQETQQKQDLRPMPLPIPLYDGWNETNEQAANVLPCPQNEEW